jgi:ketosteroid isomerase-like protein
LLIQARFLVWPRWRWTSAIRASGLDKLLKAITAELESMGTSIDDNIIAEGDFVVLQQHATGRTTKTGKPYNNRDCFVYKVINGITEYLDTELVTSAFGR